MMNQVEFRICSKEDAPAISQFLWSLKDDFRFTELSIIDEITQLLFEKGGAIGGYRDTAMVGMFGYFRGEPSCGYANQEVGFIYIAGLAKAARRTGVFRAGAQFLIETLKAMGVREIRCHAAEHDAYTNRLYAHLGDPIAREKNRRGDTCILYANTIDDVLARLATPRRKRTINQPAPTIIA